MKSNKSKELAQYWQKTSQHDYETMLGLYRIKRYSDALFYGHIVLEKILKAHVAKATKQEVPRTHNLAYLVELSKVDIDDETRKFLAVVSRFNMRTRYPDIKLNFYKLCTPAYTKDNLTKIKKLYKDLCQKLTRKK